MSAPVLPPPPGPPPPPGQPGPPGPSGSSGDGDPAAEPRRLRVLPPPDQRWHFRRSLATRVLLLTTIAVGLAVTVLSIGVYVTARAQLQSTLDDSLITRAKKTAAGGALGARLEVPAAYLGAADIRLFLALNDLEGRNAAIAYDGYEPIPVVGAPEFAVAAGARSESVRTVAFGGERYRVVAVPTPTPGRAIVIAQSLENQERVLSRLGAASLIFGGLGVLGAGIAGWAVARNGLRPVRRLTSQVEQIAVTEKLDALPVEGDDEIARLATAFNDMLAALSASRDRQRRLVTDAGHELRTPLTSLRTNVDLLTQVDAAEQDMDPQMRAELLSDIRGQIDELTTLIGDLTELARDEPLAPVVGEVDLGEVVDAAVSRVRRRAADRTLDVTTVPWLVIGEAPALERAVTNLLDNAVKWSPAGGLVTVRLAVEPDPARADGTAVGVLTVDDQGPGIAAPDRERVFDRFWRAEESRSMPGSGLGLSIVRQVAQRHHGSVIATDAPTGGARLVLRLPGRPSA
ncbi:HAMP domain-containing sensor histidine kinase [Nocardioides marinquilinus]|uniref:histidine kinase n=1 Tax=Nocardioides marinquilinus TaxID=1210400 RepID=A0ABP9Q6G6_9ACTN